jgi:peptidoglycan/xylan/chitin deacetylase (PgdA/CDA1 family)
MPIRPTLAKGIARRLFRASPKLASIAEGTSAAARILRHVASNRRVGLVVLFHRVGEKDGDPRHQLVPSVGVARFRRQLRCMRRLFRPVPAAEIHLAACGRRRWRRIPIAVTFDDEWSTHVSLALPALRAEGMRATFFLTGAQLAGTAPFWWELLQEATDRGIRTDEIVPGDDIFEQAALLTAAPPTKRDEVTAALSALGRGEPASAMRPDDIRRLAAEQDIGFHTLRHHPLDTLSAVELREALHEGREQLERVVGRPLTLLAYPHGAAGPREARAAQAAGFSLGFTTNWEPIDHQGDALLLGRIEPGPVPLSGFLRTLAQSLGA